MSRAAVVNALRELAAALEALSADEWERVGPSLSQLSSSVGAAAAELDPPPLISDNLRT